MCIRDRTNALRSSFRPEKVEFSREHQQSAVQWTRLKSENDLAGFNVRRVCTPEVVTRLQLATQRRPGRRFALSYFIDSASLDGDDSHVLAVVSRTGTILQTGSIFHKMWQVITNQIRQQSSGEVDIERLAMSVLAATSFDRHLLVFAKRDRSGEREYI